MSSEKESSDGSYRPLGSVAVCKRWMEKVVIGHKFCPFARQPFEKNQIRFTTSKFTDLLSFLNALSKEYQLLDDYQNIETVLVVIESGLGCFSDYLDHLAMANRQLQELGYEGKYQLASFHPEYLFSGSDQDDPANYTNRSPFPMIHILREASIEKVLEKYSNPDQIPSRNIALAREKGLDYWKEIVGGLLIK